MSIRRWALGWGAVLTAVLACAASAWACASVGAVDVSPAVVQPGQEVAVRVTFVNKDKVVELRWDAINGPLLGTIDPLTFSEGLHGNWRFADTRITIPADAKPGNHLLIAHQEAVRGTATWGMPARGLVQVSSAGSPVLGQQAGPPPVLRPNALVSEDSVSAGTLVVVGLGAAGFTLLVAGVGIILASWRRSRPAAAPVRTARS